VDLESGHGLRLPRLLLLSVAKTAARPRKERVKKPLSFRSGRWYQHLLSTPLGAARLAGRQVTCTVSTIVVPKINAQSGPFNTCLCNYTGSLSVHDYILWAIGHDAEKSKRRMKRVRSTVKSKRTKVHSVHWLPALDVTW
jgi:hypothetical protein